MIEYIILGIVQGISEFLPISSSGHLVFLKEFFKIDANIFLDTFLHLATFLAIVVFYFKDILKIFQTFFSNWSYTRKLIIASLPVIFAGFFLNSFFENIRSVFVVAIMLLLISIYMFVAEKYAKKPEKPLSFFGSLVVGFSQIIALIPGSSRSGVTISTALLLGEKKNEAIRFSFLIALPATLGAFTLEFIKLPNKLIFVEPNFIVAFVVSFIVGLISIKLLVGVLNKFGFMPFIIYRVLLSFILLATLIK